MHREIGIYPMSKLPHEMETPAQRMKKYLNELLAKFSKTPYVIPTGMAIAAGVYALVLMYAGTFCLSGLIAPVVLLGVMWQLGVKGVKKLLIIGAASCLVFSGVWAWYYTDYYQHVDPAMATSTETVVSNNITVPMMADGLVTPLFGTSSTVFNFTVMFNLPDNSTTWPIENVSMAIANINFPSAESHNYSMLRVASVDNKTAHYYYSGTVSKPVNQFIFWANINGNWVVATEHRGGNEYALNGPTYKDSYAVVAPLIPVGLVQVFVSFYPIYALLLLMIWWTKRARKMRVESYEKAVSEKEKETKDIPKEDKKVPSLAKAMGLEKGEDFVCSECGADVPAVAKVCPKCGEKFD
jgi:ribosomal protein L40E